MIKNMHNNLLCLWKYLKFDSVFSQNKTYLDKKKKKTIFIFKYVIFFKSYEENYKIQSSK